MCFSLSVVTPVLNHVRVTIAISALHRNFIAMVFHGKSHGHPGFVISAVSQMLIPAPVYLAIYHSPIKSDRATVQSPLTDSFAVGISTLHCTAVLHRTILRVHPDIVMSSVS